MLMSDLTVRIRGKVGFTQSCNTAFSGLAADGAKLALWNLMQVRSSESLLSNE